MSFYRKKHSSLKDFSFFNIDSFIIFLIGDVEYFTIAKNCLDEYINKITNK